MNLDFSQGKKLAIITITVIVTITDTCLCPKNVFGQ